MVIFAIIAFSGPDKQQYGVMTEGTVKTSLLNTMRANFLKSYFQNTDN